MTRVVAGVAIAVLTFVGCAGGDQVTGDRRNVGVVSVVFSARPAKARVGQAVRLQLKLVNNSGQQRDIVFSDTQRYDFWVERGGREAWRWSAGRSFAQTVTTVNLVSQDPHTFAETWTPETSGTYGVFGHVTSEGYERPLAGRVVVE